MRTAVREKMCTKCFKTLPSVVLKNNHPSKAPYQLIGKSFGIQENRRPVLETTGSTSNRFYRQPVTHADLIQNSFRSRSKHIENSSRTLADLIRNSSRTHSELPPNSGRAHSNLILKSRRNHSGVTQESFGTHSELVQNSARSHSELIRN
jgi:hypothetical protein